MDIRLMLICGVLIVCKICMTILITHWISASTRNPDGANKIALPGILGMGALEVTVLVSIAMIFILLQS